MSGVAQVKKRFEEFESFLRKDKEALRRLKLLKDDVNVLRTSLAAAEKKEELAEVIKNSARGRADKAEMAFAETEKENDRLNQIVAGLQRRLSDLEMANKSEDESDFTDQSASNAGTESTVRHVIKLIRKEIREMPQHEKRIMIDGQMQSVFQKEQLISGWSHKALWTLGASVALWSYVWGGIVIKSKERSQNLNRDGDPGESSFSRNAASWMIKSIDDKITPERLLYDLTTMT